MGTMTKKRSKSKSPRKQEEEPSSSDPVEDVVVSEEHEEKDTESETDSQKKRKVDDHDEEEDGAKKKKKKRDEEEEEETTGEIPASNVKKGFFSEQSFASLPLTEATQKSISVMGHDTMTKIQFKAIPALLAGKDLIGAAQTGSGKTLAFLIPIVEVLRKAKFSTRNGTGAMVLSPTRELAMQTYGVCKELLGDTSTLTYGLIMGGANRKTESERLKKGVNIVIATPGRLLDRLQNSPGFT